MKLSVYSLYDTVALNFNPPFVKPNNGTAIRGLADAVRKDSNLENNAKDYALYLIGEWDDSTGVIEKNEPQLITQVAQIVARLNEGEL